MTLLKEIAAELVGMFVGDVRMSLMVLLLVAFAGILIEFAGLDPLVGGVLLVIGCPVLLIANVRRATQAPLRR